MKDVVLADAKEPKLSLKKAVEKHCRDCIYDSCSPGTWVAQVEACTAPDCALYEHRPLTQATKDRLRQERYEKMTPEERENADRKAEQARDRLEKYRFAHKNTKISA